MRQKRIYRLNLEDEAHLRRRVSIVLTPVRIWLGLSLIILLLIFVTALLLVYTPMRHLLPSYVPEAQRIEAQQALIRIDSLSRQVALTNAWIENYRRVSNPGRSVTDTEPADSISGDYDPDMLPDASPAEKQFVSAMDERERFNISVLAPLDADGMLFGPVSPHAYFPENSRKAVDPTILLTSDAPIQAVADGTVLAVYYHASMHGYTILIQHARGFVSSYSHAGTPLVVNGDAVNGGQPIAYPANPDSRATRWMQLRLWHNATPLVPYSFLQ